MMPRVRSKPAPSRRPSLRRCARQFTPERYAKGRSSPRATPKHSKKRSAHRQHATNSPPTPSCQTTNSGDFPIALNGRGRRGSGVIGRNHCYCGSIARLPDNKIRPGPRRRQRKRGARRRGRAGPFPPEPAHSNNRGRSGMFQSCSARDLPATLPNRFSEPNGSPVPRSIAVNFNRRLEYPDAGHA
jgi:hypothetical protein